MRYPEHTFSNCNVKVTWDDTPKPKELRDEFAMAALANMSRNWSPAKMAAECYLIADAMLERREK